jgi:hypothetical protein
MSAASCTQAWTTYRSVSGSNLRWALLLVHGLNYLQVCIRLKPQLCTSSCTRPELPIGLYQAQTSDEHCFLYTACTTYRPVSGSKLRWAVLLVHGLYYLQACIRLKTQMSTASCTRPVLPTGLYQAQNPDEHCFLYTAWTTYRSVSGSNLSCALLLVHGLNYLQACIRPRHTTAYESTSAQ